jgi:SAM-dependent methyltransferase
VDVDRAADNWYADEALWAETYAFMFPDSAFEAAAEQVDPLIELSQVEGGSVLDVGCGPGRYAVPFARRGFAVTGVDITPFLLQKARANAEAENVEVELVEEDMRSFRRPGTFDLALSMLTSFGYFDDEGENLAVLENIYASLKPGGVFIFDTYGKEIIARVFEETFSKELPDGSLIVQRRSVISDWSQMENEWLLIKEGRTRRFLLRHWIYSGREFKELLVNAGFSDVRLCGDLKGKPYGRDAERLIAVGRKA